MCDVLFSLFSVQCVDAVFSVDAALSVDASARCKGVFSVLMFSVQWCVDAVFSVEAHQRAKVER